MSEFRRTDREAIRESLEFWQPRASRPLTPEDARQITENAVGYFRVLLGWDEEERRQRSNPDPVTAVPALELRTSPPRDGDALSVAPPLDNQHPPLKE